jgi:hypothetical protein
LEPLQNPGRYYDFLEFRRQALLHDFLWRVRLATFAAVAGAVVVDVLALLRFADQNAAAMPTAYEAGESEVVLDSVLLRFDAPIKQGLNLGPSFAASYSFMLARIASTYLQ